MSSDPPLPVSSCWSLVVAALSNQKPETRNLNTDSFTISVTMAKAEIKTKETNGSVDEFLDGLPDEQQRSDAYAILEMMKRATGNGPRMWGGAIVGFGNRVYRSPATGREVDWMKIGF